MNQYIFDTNSQEQEYRRLQLIEAAHDPATIKLLLETGIQPGWHCLELGPGAGSILRWLGRSAGLDGLAVGVDKTTAYLQDFPFPPFRVHEGSFLEVPLTHHSFDLIHGRYVLIHNTADRDILTQMLTLLKPGGWAVIEEPDFTSATLPDPGKVSPQARVNRAICRMFTNLGLNPGYGLLLPRKMEEVGYQLVRTQSVLHLCRGGSPIAKVMGESALALQEKYCQTGLCTVEDIHQYVHLSQDSSHWTIYHSTTAVIARKPLI